MRSAGRATYKASAVEVVEVVDAVVADVDVVDVVLVGCVVVSIHRKSSSHSVARLACRTLLGSDGPEDLAFWRDGLVAQLVGGWQAGFEQGDDDQGGGRSIGRTYVEAVAGERTRSAVRSAQLG